MLEVRLRRDFWNLSYVSTLVVAATVMVLIGIVHKKLWKSLYFL